MLIGVGAQGAPRKLVHKMEIARMISIRGKMMINSETIKKAREIRRAAAKKWGCEVAQIDWASCVAMALRGEEIESVEEQIKKHELVYSTKEWQTGKHDRLYIYLDGQTREFRGNRTHQLYYDRNSGKLVEKWGKGYTSDAYDESRKKFLAEFASIYKRA